MRMNLPGYAASVPDVTQGMNRLMDGFNAYRGNVRQKQLDDRQAEETQYQRGQNALTMAMRQKEFDAGQAERAERRKMESARFDMDERAFNARMADRDRGIEDEKATRRAFLAGSLADQIAGMPPEQQQQALQSFLQSDADLAAQIPETYRSSPQSTLGFIRALAGSRGYKPASRGLDAFAPSSVREWEHFSSLSPEDQQRYLVMKRSGQFLDTGTGYVRPDQLNPGAPPVQTVDKNIAEAEREKVVGRETGEAQMGLPKVARGLEMYERKGQEISAAIGRAKQLAAQFGTTGFVGGLTRAVPGTPAYSLARSLDPIIANIGFDELQSMRDNSPTGGALGQVAVQELAMLQSVLGSLDQAQQPQEVIAALDAIERIRADFREMKRRAYEEDVRRFGVAAVPRPDSAAQPAAGQPTPAPQQRPDPLGLFGN